MGILVVNLIFFSLINFTEILHHMKWNYNACISSDKIKKRIISFTSEQRLELLKSKFKKDETKTNKLNKQKKKPHAVGERKGEKRPSEKEPLPPRKKKAVSKSSRDSEDSSACEKELLPSKKKPDNKISTSSDYEDSSKKRCFEKEHPPL